MQVKEIQVNGTAGTLWGGLDVQFELRINGGEGGYQSAAITGGDLRLSYFNNGATKLIGTYPLKGVGGIAVPASRETTLAVSVDVPLDPMSLERLDEFRAGKDLTLHLGCRLSAIARPNGPPDALPVEYHGQAQYIVRRSDWADHILPASNMHLVDLWELRRGAFSRVPELEGEARRMNQAIESLNHGRWKEAFAHAREVSDSLRARKDLPILSDPSIVKALFDFLSQALHEEKITKGAWEPSRSDAILAVSSSKGVLDWAASLLDGRT